MNKEVEAPHPSTSLSYTYADLIVDNLLQIDVEYIFGIPGGAIEPLLNAIARKMRGEHPNTQLQERSLLRLRQRNKKRFITPIIAKNECAAAYMADGYTRETGKLGVCFATTGPGSTNLITGVASAYADNIPMLVITPQTALKNFGRKGLQESSKDGVDVVGMFECCTRYNTLVSHPDQLISKLHKALITAYSRPRGPVHLSIPMDILRSPATRSAFPSFTHIATLFRESEEVAFEGVVPLMRLLVRAKKTVIFIGEGCAQAATSIVTFAEKLKLKIVSTPDAKSWINPFHPLYCGVFGFAGHTSARHALLDPEVDLIIAVGTAFGELSTNGWDEALLNRRLVHIDNTIENFSRSPMAQLHLACNIERLFTLLTETLTPDIISLPCSITNPSEEHPPTITIEDAGESHHDAAPVHPAHLMYELACCFPEGTRFLIDAGNAWAWAIHHLHLRETNCFRIAMGFGAMAWAISAAIGTALGNRTSPIVCITGDGSLLMSSLEITTAVTHQLPVIFLVLNDSTLGMVKHGQRMANAEPIAFELPQIDYAEMARTLGANGFTITTLSELVRLNFEELLTADRPTLLDVRIDGSAEPPMMSRVRVLNTAGKDNALFDNCA